MELKALVDQVLSRTGLDLDEALDELGVDADVRDGVKDMIGLYVTVGLAEAAGEDRTAELAMLDAMRLNYEAAGTAVLVDAAKKVATRIFEKVAKTLLSAMLL